VEARRRELVYRLIVQLCEEQQAKLRSGGLPAGGQPRVAAAFTVALDRFTAVRGGGSAAADRLLGLTGAQALKASATDTARPALSAYTAQFGEVLRAVVGEQTAAEEAAAARPTERTAVRATKAKVMDRAQVWFVRMLSSVDEAEGTARPCARFPQPLTCLVVRQP
jgi:hypothetical protein